jgi:hypothetical protein
MPLLLASIGCDIPAQAGVSPTKEIEVRDLSGTNSEIAFIEIR